MSRGDPTLPFLAVGRISTDGEQDGVILCSYTSSADSNSPNPQEEKYKDIFTQLLKAAKMKLKDGQRTRLEWKPASVCCLMDPQGVFLYCVVTAQLEYPENIAYTLLYDLVVEVGHHNTREVAGDYGLQEAMKPALRKLVKSYEDPVNFGRARDAQDNAAISPPHDTSQYSAGDPAGPRDRRTKLIGMAVFAVVVLILIIWFFTGQSSGESDPAPTPAPTAIVTTTKKPKKLLDEQTATKKLEYTDQNGDLTSIVSGNKYEKFVEEVSMSNEGAKSAAIVVLT